MNSSKDDCGGRTASARRLFLGCLLFLLPVSPARADSWQQRAPVPGPRAAHSAVWTGREMIVWGGGVDGSFLNTGARYVPSTDTWRETSPYGAPSPRWFHAAVWTGSEMIIWGGRANFSPKDHSSDGARYHPATDTWTPMSTEGAPTPRSQFAAVWTGSELIVWGGETEGGLELNDGAKYDPATDTWTSISSDSGLEPRMEPTGIWTGEELIVFGGMKFTGGQLSFGNGARYNPVSNTWRPLPSEGSPRSRTGHTAIWTGERMIVWGGREMPAYELFNDGSIYNPGSDAWTPIPFSYDAPQARMYHATVWTGSEMILWGGHTDASGILLNTGARFNPATGAWAPTTPVNAPGKRMFWRPDLGIWTGRGMLVCAGSDYPASLDSTYLYSLADPPCPPVIREQPQSLSVAVGSPVTLSVGVGDCATAAYPFSTQTSDGPYSHRFEFETGANTGQLQIDYDFFNIPDSLRVYYEDQLIFDSDLSGEGTIRVPYGPGSARGVSMVVNQDGGPASTAWEYTVRFRPSLRFQWRKDGTALAGETNATLHFSSVSVADAGEYSVAVGNGSGTVVSAVATLTVLSGPQSTNCVAAPSGLGIWWPFDGNFKDAVSQSALTIVGAPSFAAGKAGQALHFDGINDGVKASASAALNVGTNEGFSIELWVNPQNVTLQPLVVWTPRAGIGGAHFYLGGYGAGSIYANVVDVNGGQHSWRSDTGLVVVNEWQHVGMSYDKLSGLLRFYLNGQKVTEYALGSFTPLTESDAEIGYQALSGEHFTGSMDELSIYRRVLTDAEMTSIYNAGAAGKCGTNAPLPCTLPGLVAWWRGDGDATEVTGAHDGSLLFGTTFSPGVSGQAFTFDLSLARVSIPDDDAFKLTDSLSFEGWINVASHAPGIIFIRGDNRGGLDPYHMSIQPSGQLHWGINTAENDFTGLYSPSAVSTGVWTHVAAVLDGVTGNMGLYVNGSLVNQTNTSLRPLRDLDPNWEPAIGIGNAGGTFHHFPYHGLVDEWALYSRALSAAEIQGIFNAGAAGKCATNAPPRVDLVFNGSFEMATVAPGTIDGLNSTAITGWTVQDIDYYGSPWVAGDGLRSLDMNGWIPGRINQEVSGFVVGQTYRLAFLMAGNPYFIPPLPAIKRLRAAIGAASHEYSFDATGHSESDLGWISHTLDFTATSPVMNLTFSSLTESAGGAALDRVSITLLTNAPPTNCVAAPSGLVAWWSLDGNLRDSVNHSELLLESSPGMVPGKVGQALRFDGIDDGARVPASAALNVGTNEGFSIEVWVNPARVTMQPLVGWTPLGNIGGAHFWLGVYGAGSIYANLVDVNGGQHSWRSDTDLLAENEWQHVGMSYDKPAGLLRFYLNGQKVTEHALGSFTPLTGSDVEIGYRANSSEYFAGTMDELSIYRRVLNDEEMRSIYNSGAAGKCSGTNPPQPVVVFDVSRDFSPSANPTGPWSYGYSATLGGPFQLLTFAKSFAANNGVPISAWQVTDSLSPSVNRVMGNGVAVSEGGAFTAPSGTVYVWPGNDGSPGVFGLIRFTVPAGGSGAYRIESAARSNFDGPVSGDSDFHILKNGQEVFGEFLAPNSATGWSNTLALAAGDSIDFAVGRGADGSQDHSSLKVHAVISLVTSVPPPTNRVFDLSGDFSLSANPNGPWSYGHLTGSISGSFQLLNTSRTFGAENSVPIDIWQLNNAKPWVAKVIGPDTAISTHFNGPPGTVYFGPDPEVEPRDYAAIRFTVPSGAGGTYRLATSVRSLYDSTRSVDADFHVVKNGSELFGRLVPPNSGTSYSNTLSLVAGDRIDFVAGRGTNGLPETGLKIQATLTRQVVMAMSIGSVLPLAGGSGVRVTGHAPPGMVCRVQRSVNLIDWEDAGSAPATTSGIFEFIDTQPADGPACFYRLRDSNQ